MLRPLAAVQGRRSRWSGFRVVVVACGSNAGTRTIRSLGVSVAIPKRSWRRKRTGIHECRHLCWLLELQRQPRRAAATGTTAATEGCNYGGRDGSRGGPQLRGTRAARKGCGYRNAWSAGSESCQSLEEVGEGLSGTTRIQDANAGGYRVANSEADGHAVIVIGVDIAGAIGPGTMVNPSGRSSTCWPSLRSSVASAATRSVSLSRACSIPRMVVGPLANGAMAARVCAVSEMAFRSRSTREEHHAEGR